MFGAPVLDELQIPSDSGSSNLVRVLVGGSSPTSTGLRLKLAKLKSRKQEAESTISQFLLAQVAHFHLEEL
jgi:ABC-type protease/lipase transport system fused ATPase/permease subunit